MNAQRVRFVRMVLAVSPLLPLLAGAVPTGVQYQGRLLDAVGQPTNGTVTMAVAIYTNATTGASVYTESIGPVTVQDGLYSFSFGNAAGFDDALGRPECWLQLTVNGSALSPRQRLLAVPYARRAGGTAAVDSNTVFAAGVVPGAAIADGAIGTNHLAAAVQPGWTDDGTTVRLSNSSDDVRIGVSAGGAGRLYVLATAANALVATAGTDYAVSAYVARNNGVYGYAAQNFGVHGNAAQNFGVRGAAGNLYGVYGYAVNYGVWGTAQNNYAVYGNAWRNYGVYGEAAHNYGVYGSAAASYGVYGTAAQNFGVVGVAYQNYGVYGEAVENYGVYAVAKNRAVAGWAANNFGVYGNAAASYGVYGTAALHRAVAGAAGGQYGGWFSGASTGLYTEARTPGGVAILAAGLIQQNGTNVSLAGHSHTVGSADIVDGTITDTDVSASANIAGSKVATATTSARGTVQFATNGQTAAGLAVQANDGRLGDSRPPAGAASGDLTGTYPSPQIASGVIVDANVSAIANIAGSKVAAATTSTRGTVELAQNGQVGSEIVVQASDTRLSDSRTPTGVAGGDLAGTYPNPSLSSEYKGWTDDGTTVRLTTSSDSVGIGTAGPLSGKLHVETTQDNAVYGYSAQNYAVYANAGYYGVYGHARLNVGVYGKADYCGVYGNAIDYGVYGSAPGGRYGVYGNANKFGVYGYAAGGNGVYGEANYCGVYGNAIDSGVMGYAAQDNGVFGYAVQNNGISGFASDYGVYGKVRDSYGVYGNAATNYGVYGHATSYGVHGFAQNYGVSARALYNNGVYGNAWNFGVYGYALGNNGVYGEAADSMGVCGYADTVGVFGHARVAGVYGQADFYGGWFEAGDGNAIRCDGNMLLADGCGVRWIGNGALKAFTIDHPLDPACKVLRHFSTEGPEALVIYSGTAVLDATGQAAVVLPDYFDALSRDARVQLTPVGNHRVFVAEEVRGNTFTIGGDARAKVYWQVTAERDDPKARLERIARPVEQFKGTPGAPAKGQYVSPECYR